MSWITASVGFGFLVLTACSSTEWVNMNDSRADFIADYNKCERQAYEDPRYQAGMKLIVDESRDRCMAKLGWRLREKQD